MIDQRIIDLATQLTIKGMGADASVANWIGNADQVADFLRTMTHTLNELYNERATKMT